MSDLGSGLEFLGIGPPAPRQAGRYRILEEIARGGMGIVFRAHDPALDRPLAVKVLHGDLASNPDIRARFLAEARITSQLQHPGIPPVHEVGTLDDGRPFFALKLIQGNSLEELLAERRNGHDDLAQQLTVFEQVCQTVAYAHSKGVIHRDLKPSNIMVGAFGEVQVMDWGLAQGAGCAARNALAAWPVCGTVESTILGTPAFMAPEQAWGADGDERTDVFGLGGILCMMLTGQPPFPVPDSPLLCLLGVRADRSEIGQRLQRCGADEELVHLALRCLADDPAERPRDAAEVAQAVAAYQADMRRRLDRAEVERASAQLRAAEESKRRRLTVALAIALLALMGMASAAILWYQHEQQRRHAEQAQRRGQVEQDLAASLREVAELRHRIQDASSNGERSQALRAARTAVRHARALCGEIENIDAQLSAQLEEQARLLDADERDLRLIEAAGKARLEQTRLDPARGRFLPDRAFSMLVGALAEYGLPLASVTAEVAADRLGTDRLRQERITVLDQMLAGAPAGEQPARVWLAGVLDRLDPDPWRRQTRAALVRGDSSVLRRLAVEADVARQPAAFLAVLANALPADPPSDRLALLRRALRCHPDDFWLNLQLGTALCQPALLWGTYRHATPAERLPLVEAAGHFRAALSRRPDSAAVLLNLGFALRMTGDTEGAASAYHQALEREPAFSAAWNNLASVLQEQGDRAGADLAYQQAIRLAPASAVPLVNLACAQLHGGQLVEALHLFRRALEYDRRHAVALAGLGAALVEMGERSAGLLHLRQAERLATASVPALLFLGDGLRSAGDFPAALRVFERATQLDPSCADAHARRGTLLMDLKQPQPALHALRQALALQPDHRAAHRLLGPVLEQLGDRPGALAAYRKAVAVEPSSPSAHNNLGAHLQAQGDLGAALAAYRKAASLEPRRGLYHANIASVLLARHQIVDAVAAYRRAVHCAPTTARFHFQLGHALLRQGKTAEAITACRRAVELDPSSGDAWRVLSTTLASTGDRRGALTAARKAVKAHPDDPVNQGALGEALFRLGHFDEAARTTQRALALLPAGHPARDIAQRQLADCQRMAVLARRLPDVLAGRDRPQRPGDEAELARLCLYYRDRPADAVRLYVSAFLREPALAGSPGSTARYDAACAAARASAMPGQPAVALRRLALNWLHAEYRLHRRGSGAALAERLRLWHGDPDLAAVRDPAALGRLPEEERRAWQHFWNEVDRARKRSL